MNSTSYYIETEITVAKLYLNLRARPFQTERDQTDIRSSRIVQFFTGDVFGNRRKSALTYCQSRYLERRGRRVQQLINIRYHVGYLNESVDAVYDYYRRFLLTVNVSSSACVAGDKSLFLLGLSSAAWSVLLLRSGLYRSFLPPYTICVREKLSVSRFAPVFATPEFPYRTGVGTSPR